MQGFEISSHCIRTREWDGDGGAVHSHTLELEGENDRAFLMFDPCLDLERLGQVVGYVTDGGDGSLSIIGWFPLDVFENYRRLLEGSDRITVEFELRDGGTGAGYLRRLALRRGGTIVAANSVHGPQGVRRSKTASAGSR